jgi:hypothetical protein
MFAILSLGVHTAEELYHLTYADLNRDLGKVIIQERIKSYIGKLLSL